MRKLPFLIILLTFLLDQGTKILVVQFVEKTYDKTIEKTHDKTEDIPVVRIIFVENEGIAFGLFSKHQGLLKDLLLTSLTLIAISMVIYLYRSAEKEKIILRSALALILGGALGNLSDKLLGHIIFHQEWDFPYRKVVDFIDVGIGNCDCCRWPTFNVADMAISIGGLIFVFYILKNKEYDAVNFLGSKKNKEN